MRFNLPFEGVSQYFLALVRRHCKRFSFAFDKAKEEKEQGRGAGKRVGEIEREVHEAGRHAASIETL